MPREVTAPDGTVWSCVPPYAGLSGDATPDAARVDGTADRYHLVCTPDGGAASVRIEVGADWADAMSDDALLAAIDAAAADRAA